jgi:hypothetical protein
MVIVPWYYKKSKKRYFGNFSISLNGVYTDLNIFQEEK